MYAPDRIPMYEGDGIIRSGCTPGNTPNSPAPSSARAADRGIEQNARRLRRETLSRLLDEIAAWVGRKLN